MLQFTISSAVLSAALTDLNRVINRRASLPVLENIHTSMDASGRIRMTVMDDNVYAMTKTLQADRWTGSGMFLVDADQLTNALKGLPEQDVTIDCEGEEIAESVRIAYNGGSLAFLVGGSMEHWPVTTPREDDATCVYITGKTLVDGIARVQFAAAKNDVRIIMTGVYMERMTDRLTFAASDGRMLSLTDRTPDFDSDDFSAILPPKLCDILRASVKTGSSVKMAVTSEHIYFDYGNTSLDARLIEGRYPAYRNVVPTSNPYHIEIDRKTLIASVRRVGLFAPSASQLLRVEYKGGRLAITGRDLDLFSRSMTETIPTLRAWADNGDMPDTLAIGLSAKYLNEQLSHFGSDKVELQIADPSRPVVFKGDNATSLLMPMMLDDDKPVEEPTDNARADVEAAVAARNEAVAAKRDSLNASEEEEEEEADGQDDVDELDAALAAGPDNEGLAA